MTTAPLTVAAVGQALIRQDLQPYLDAAPSQALTAFLQDADVRFTNLEGCLTGPCCWPTKDGPIIITPPGGLVTLCRLGFNALSLSNNHAFDLGPGGILATLKAVAQHDLLSAGIGIDATDAGRPRIRRFGHTRVALIAMDCGPQPDYVYALNARDDIGARPGLNRLRILTHEGQLTVDPQDAQRNLTAIAEAASTADFRLVYLHNHHWEKVLTTTPLWLQTFARQCVDAGAHLVVMHGVPLLHGLEIYRRQPIFYSLGTFIFHSIYVKRWVREYGMRTWQSLIARCRFAPDRSLEAIELLPIIAGGDPDELLAGRWTARAMSRPAQGEEAESILHDFQCASTPFGVTITDEAGRGVVRID